jgi:mannose-6-phosphate isomerase-like protein (cupin superfamily)
MSGYIQITDTRARHTRAYSVNPFTAEQCQLVLVALQPGEKIGAELHPLDQYFRIEDGEGEAVLNGVRIAISPGYALIVPAGTRHHILNTGSIPLRLYTVCVPPNYRDGKTSA